MELFVACPLFLPSILSFAEKNSQKRAFLSGHGCPEGFRKFYVNFSYVPFLLPEKGLPQLSRKSVNVAILLNEVSEERREI